MVVGSGPRSGWGGIIQRVTINEQTNDRDTTDHAKGKQFFLPFSAQWLCASRPARAGRLGIGGRWRWIRGPVIHAAYAQQIALAHTSLGHALLALGLACDFQVKLLGVCANLAGTAGADKVCNSADVLLAKSLDALEKPRMLLGCPIPSCLLGLRGRGGRGSGGCGAGGALALAVLELGFERVDFGARGGQRVAQLGVHALVLEDHVVQPCALGVVDEVVRVVGGERVVVGGG
mmetsp:Transcript_2461/g.5669  ORF Transcript_2461/g.5669 Transcript_2461/m.5669 type:complete len:233 (+) Transcript_2461:228-926(+)